MLSSMRLCSNVPSQYSIELALESYQDMMKLTAESGRLYQQRQLAVSQLNDIKGISCTMPKGAFYCFPKLDRNIYPIEDDTMFFKEFLEQERVLVVQGTGFNWNSPDHFRIVFLSNIPELQEAISRLENFLQKKRKEFGTD